MGAGPAMPFGGIIVRRESVERFLNVLRAMIDSGQLLLDKNREKNKRARIILNIVKDKDIFDEVYDLSYAEYWSGPEREIDLRYSPGDVWIFKRIVNGHVIYIKVKEFDGANHGLVLSFHPDWM